MCGCSSLFLAEGFHAGGDLLQRLGERLVEFSVRHLGGAGGRAAERIARVFAGGARGMTDVISGNPHGRPRNGVHVSDAAQLIQKIRATLAPCRLGEWPTPLEPAPALARALGLAELALKREDRASHRYGGNKVRGLEFLLAGASPGTVFVTVGGTGSTHCLATAVHAAAAGGRAALAHPTRSSSPSAPAARPRASRLRWARSAGPPASWACASRR